jgi:hypothetical protein
MESEFIPDIDALTFNVHTSMKTLARTPHLVVFVLIFLVSCSKDDEPTNPLLGTWILKATTAQNCKDPRQNVTVTFLCDIAACSKYIFAADGSLKMDEVTSTQFTSTDATYTISNTTVVIHINGEQDPALTRTFNFDVSEPNNLYLKEVFAFGTGKCGATTVFMR